MSIVSEAASLFIREFGLEGDLSREELASIEFLAAERDRLRRENGAAIIAAVCRQVAGVHPSVRPVRRATVESVNTSVKGGV